MKVHKIVRGQPSVTISLRKLCLTQGATLHEVTCFIVLITK